MKYEPLRKCAACNGRFPKEKLLRVVRFNEEFSVDKTHKKNGRGAYVCLSAECVEKAIHKRQLNRSFRQTVPQEIYDELASLQNSLRSFRNDS